jgi:putative restriction endonuclease
VGISDVTADSVLTAIAEFDALGQDDFLAKYGFGRARKFVLVHNDRTYDSRAIVGAAHHLATGQSLPAATFSGGEQTVVALLTRLGFDVRDTSVQPSQPKVRIGDVPGVEVGTVFASRRDVAAAGIHRAIQAGITGTGATGAESIVVSGGYEDDQDNGWEIVYTGHGGRDESGRQTSDQTFDAPGNAALQSSHLTGAPVRVVRGAHHSSAHAPHSGYRYDGLFRVERVWRERGLSGYLICRFTMVTLDAGPATEHSDLEQADAAPDFEPTGTDAPDRRSATVQRLVRSVQVAEYVKKLHDHICQACGTRLVIGSRAYSEGAHIRALGRPHNGPDVPANMLCLCPNCHVLFDNGALLISDNLAVTVNGDPIGVLSLHSNHVVERVHLAYHRSMHL